MEKDSIYYTQEGVMKEMFGSEEIRPKEKVSDVMEMCVEGLLSKDFGFKNFIKNFPHTTGAIIEEYCKDNSKEITELFAKNAKYLSSDQLNQFLSFSTINPKIEEEAHKRGKKKNQLVSSVKEGIQEVERNIQKINTRKIEEDVLKKEGTRER